MMRFFIRVLPSKKVLVRNIETNESEILGSIEDLPKHISGELPKEEEKEDE